MDRMEKENKICGDDFKKKNKNLIKISFGFMISDTPEQERKSLFNRFGS